MRQRPLPVPLEMKDKAERKQKDFTILIYVFSGIFSNILAALPLALSFSRSLLYSPPNYRALLAVCCI